METFNWQYWHTVICQEVKEHTPLIYKEKRQTSFTLTLTLLTFAVWVDAELCVQFLVSALFKDRLNVNCVLMDEIKLLFSCHVLEKPPKISTDTGNWQEFNIWFGYLATVNTASRCSDVIRTHGGGARSDMVTVERAEPHRYIIQIHQQWWTVTEYIYTSRTVSIILRYLYLKYLSISISCYYSLYFHSTAIQRQIFYSLHLFYNFNYFAD